MQVDTDNVRRRQQTENSGLYIYLNDIQWTSRERKRSAMRTEDEYFGCVVSTYTLIALKIDPLKLLMSFTSFGIWRFSTVTNCNVNLWRDWKTVRLCYFG